MVITRYLVITDIIVTVVHTASIWPSGQCLGDVLYVRVWVEHLDWPTSVSLHTYTHVLSSQCNTSLTMLHHLLSYQSFTKTIWTWFFTPRYYCKMASWHLWESNVTATHWPCLVHPGISSWLNMDKSSLLGNPCICLTLLQAVHHIAQ